MDVIRQERPDFIFLCETIGRKDKMEWLRRKIGYDGVFAVEPQGRSEGITLLWKEMNQTKLLGYSTNHIDVEVNILGMTPWRLTGFYGDPDRM